MKDLEHLLAFINEAEGLKSVLRTAWTASGRQESTAEHTWRLTLLVGLAADYVSVDREKAMMMSLIHDIGEIYNGDISAASLPDPAQKQSDEERDARRIFSLLLKSQQERLTALWKEYNENTTPEAKLVKALDKAETILQHCQGKNPPDFDYDFNLNYGKTYFEDDPFLMELRSLLDHKTLERMEQQEGN